MSTTPSDTHTSLLVWVDAEEIGVSVATNGGARALLSSPVHHNPLLTLRQRCTMKKAERSDAADAADSPALSALIGSAPRSPRITEAKGAARTLQTLSKVSLPADDFICDHRS